MDKARPLLALMLFSLCTSASSPESSSPLRRQTRQLPRFPLIDAIFSRLQGRPPPQSPPPNQQRRPPPQLESGFTPLGSGDNFPPGSFTGTGGNPTNFDGQRIPSAADSVDITFQSLVPQGQRQRPRPDGGDLFRRPQIPPQQSPTFFLNQGRIPPQPHPQPGNIRPGPPQINPGQFPQGDGRRPVPIVDNTFTQGFSQIPQRPSPPRVFPPPPVSIQTFSPQQGADILLNGRDIPQQFPLRQTISELGNDLQQVRNQDPFLQNLQPQQLPTAAFSQNTQNSANVISTVPAPVRRATLKEILDEDCKDFADKGFCESPQRYPTAQVTTLMSRCSRILDTLYVPIPESNSIASSLPQSKNKGSSLERANHAIWSWAKYSSTGKGSVCSSETRYVSPSYARDVAGKWVVVLQHDEGNMSQKVPVDVCKGENQPCLTGPEGEHHVGTRCVQRNTHHHLVTWDPDTPEDCPALRVFSFPTACLCHFSTET